MRTCSDITHKITNKTNFQVKNTGIPGLRALSHPGLGAGPLCPCSLRGAGCETPEHVNTAACTGKPRSQVPITGETVPFWQGQASQATGKTGALVL